MIRPTLLASAAALILSSCAAHVPRATVPEEAEEAISPSTFDGAMTLGDDAYRARDFDRAAFAYLQAMKLDPKSEQPYLRMASIHDARKEAVQLQQTLREALKRNPANAAAHERLGFTLLKLEDHEAASTEFTEAAHLDAGRWRAVMGLGLAAIARRDLDAARVHFDAALRSQPRSPELLSYSADLYLRVGDLDRALSEARAALAIAPNQATQLILGDVVARKGDYPGGLEAYLAAMTEPEAYQRLAEQAMISKDYERALRYFQQSTDVSPTYNEQVQKRIAVARERLAELRLNEKRERTGS